MNQITLAQAGTILTSVAETKPQVAVQPPATAVLATSVQMATALAATSGQMTTAGTIATAQQPVTTQLTPLVATQGIPGSATQNDFDIYCNLLFSNVPNLSIFLSYHKEGFLQYILTFALTAFNSCLSEGPHCQTEHIF